MIRAAGLMSDGTLKRRSSDGFERVYRPKVEGARNLDACWLSPPRAVARLLCALLVLHGGGGEWVRRPAVRLPMRGFLDSRAQRRVHEERAALSVRWGPGPMVRRRPGGQWRDAGANRTIGTFLLDASESLGVETLLRRIRHPTPNAVVTVCQYQKATGNCLLQCHNVPDWRTCLI